MLLGETEWTVRYRKTASHTSADLAIEPGTGATTVAGLDGDSALPATTVARDLSTALVSDGLLDSSRAQNGPTHWYKLPEWLQVRGTHRQNRWCEVHSMFHSVALALVTCTETRSRHAPLHCIAAGRHHPVPGIMPRRHPLVSLPVHARLCGVHEDPGPGGQWGWRA
jgi:hypothetical protein